MPGSEKGFYLLHSFIILLLILGTAPLVWAQDVTVVEIQIERLRSQLRDVVNLEARLQDHVAQLDEDLRPESIERSVAAIGTRDAAALRARRREELERQKADVNGQFAEALAKLAKLEAEIAAAEAEAVRLKAASLAPRAATPSPVPAASPAPPAPTPAVRRKAPARKRVPRKRSRPRRRA